MFSLWGFGIHRARRYRLSRTRWRGIRAGLSGRSAPFAWTYLWTTVLIPLTLGWILPWRAARLQRALFNETCFGDKAFTFAGRAGPLYKRFWLVWVSGIVLFIGASTAIVAVTGVPYPGTGGRVPTMNPFTREKIAAIVGIVFAALLIFVMIRAWYSSRMFNYFASETTYQGCRFHLAATVPSLVWLVASNYLIRTLSLTILSPIAEARATRYIVDRLTLRGPDRVAGGGPEPRCPADQRRRASGGVQCRCLLIPRSTTAGSATVRRQPRSPCGHASGETGLEILAGRRTPHRAGLALRRVAEQRAAEGRTHPTWC